MTARRAAHGAPAGHRSPEPLHPLGEEHRHVPARRRGHSGGGAGRGAELNAGHHPQGDVEEREQHEAPEELHGRLHALVGGDAAHAVHELVRQGVDHGAHQGEGGGQRHLGHGPHQHPGEVAVAVAGAHLGVAQAQEGEVALVPVESLGQRLHRPRSVRQRAGHGIAAGQVDLGRHGGHGPVHHLGDAPEGVGLHPRRIVGAHVAQACRHVLGESAHGTVVVGPVLRCPLRHGLGIADPHERPRPEARLAVIGEADGHRDHAVDAVVERRPQRDAGRTRLERLEGGLVVADPLGEQRHQPPAANRRRHMAKAPALRAVDSPSLARYTGTTPASLRKGHNGAMENNVDLPRKRGYRRSDAMSSRASTKPLMWLATSTTAPPRSRASACSTSTRRKNTWTRRRARPPMTRPPPCAPPDPTALTCSDGAPGTRRRRRAPAAGRRWRCYDDTMTSTTHDHPRADELPPPRTVEVADGVFAYIQPDGGWWINNTGFVVGDARRAVHRQLRHRASHPRLARRHRPQSERTSPRTPARPARPCW